MKNLVIVESPAKAKTIEKFLGKDFTVLSSYGHIRDLGKSNSDSDFSSDFSPEYIISADKKDLVKKLKAAAKTADTVWLASDEDREGEAIAWHLAEVLGLDPKKANRIVFHEITKPAILHAIEHPRHIDLDMVNAQQARRLLDRIVGFELSPVLWRKIKAKLSAGRVQSVAVRLICEREKEINDFSSEPFFRVNAIFRADGSPFRAELNHRLATRQDAEDFLQLCNDARFKVQSVSVKPTVRTPQPPFTTSTLQQEASRRLGFSVNQTMATAQRLYEGGHITYMRTDSVNLSQLALRDIAAVITADYGMEFLHARQFHTNSKGAQEAHEAIRPTYVNKATIDGSEQEKRLYDLIRRRALASQMADAKLERTVVDIDILPTTTGHKHLHIFKAEGEVVKFPGFMKAYSSEATLEKGNQNLLPPIAQGEILEVWEISATERFTLAPSRYTEATLVKKMEDLGIGRPSTYAPTIHTIQQRDYVHRGEKEGTPREYLKMTLKAGEISTESLVETTGSDKRKLVPTDTGMVVNEFLMEYFPDILDYNFTAHIEEKFDEISEGKLPWKKEINQFYDTFHPTIENVNKMRMDHKVGERLLGTDPESGRPLSVKIGRFGPLAQLGESSDTDKPLFASIPSDKSLATITLEEALELFRLPRNLGEYDGVVIQAAEGRFGPYVKYSGGFVSIPQGFDPLTITFEEAVKLIEEKKLADSQKIIKSYQELPGLQVLNGRFGPYLAYKPEGARKAVNYKLPKDADPGTLSFEEAMKIKESQDSNPKPKRSTRKK